MVKTIIKPGRKALPDDMKPVTVRLSPVQASVFRALGDGQVNRGIRKAAELLAISINPNV
jgi:hypothetical protein